MSDPVINQTPAPSSQTHSAQGFWDKLYSWITGVLPGVKVAESHDNGPSPEGNFISVDYSGKWRLAGSVPDKMMHSRPDLPEPLVYLYRGTVELRDVDGDGENLMLLVESLNDPDVLDAFETAGISVLKSEGPVMLPALQETQWRRESILTLEMTWARGYEGATTYIESVEITQINSPVKNGENNLQSGENNYTFTITKEPTNA